MTQVAADYDMAYHVSKERFAELVQQALASIPPQFADAIAEVPVEIRDVPSPRQQEQLGLRENDLLLGLYHGHPRTKRSVEDPYRLPVLVYIFQHNIEMVSNSEKQLIEQVRKTVLHEIGHHF